MSLNGTPYFDGAQFTMLDVTMGSQFRLKYTSTGTYAGGTTIKVYAVIKS